MQPPPFCLPTALDELASSPRAGCALGIARAWAGGWQGRGHGAAVQTAVCPSMRTHPGCSRTQRSGDPGRTSPGARGLQLMVFSSWASSHGLHLMVFSLWSLSHGLHLMVFSSWPLSHGLQLMGMGKGLNTSHCWGKTLALLLRSSHLPSYQCSTRWWRNDGPGGADSSKS